MQFRCLPAAVILLAIVSLTHAHKTGEEYTYMSMFLKPQTPDMVEGDDHLGRVYEQLSLHPKTPPGTSLRSSLRLQSKAQMERAEGDKNKKNRNKIAPKLPRIPITRHEKVAVKVSDEMFAGEEEEEEEEQEEEGATMDGESVPVRTVRVAKQEPNQKKKPDPDISEEFAKKYGEDLERLQTMLLKIIMKYDIESLADVPCRAHAHWMPKLLERVVAKKMLFRYFCVDTSIEVLKSMKEAVGHLGRPKFMLRRFWKESIPRADLVLTWAGLDNMQAENVRNYLIRLSRTKDKHKIIAIGSHSGILRKRGSKTMIARFTAGGQPINFREAPFKLKKPMRIIGELAKGGNDKQLYLYEARDMLE